MAGFLALPNEVVELIGERVIERHGLRAWCRMTSTCKRLWSMQLPGSAYAWSIDFDFDIEGESKVNLSSLAQRTGHLTATEPALIYAGAPWAMLRIRSTSSLSINQTLDSPRLPHLDVLRQTVEALIRSSRSFPNLTTLVNAHSIFLTNCSLTWKSFS